MTFKEKWERLPQWLQVTVYTVLGLAAIGGVGYLGFWLVGRIAGGEETGTLLPILGALALISIVFGGFRGGRRARKRAKRD